MTDFLNNDDEQQTPDENHENRYSHYSTEQPVDPRAGRLRPAAEPDEAQADETPDADAAEYVDSDTVDVDDPYGIGADVLRENGVRVADLNAQAAASGDRGPRSQVEIDREARFGSASTALRPAEWGKKGWVNRTLGMSLLPKDPSPEVRFRRGIERMQGVMPGVPVITVAQPKGGENKTGWAYTLASTLSMNRGKAAVVWDTSAATGTLAMRAQNANPDGRSVWDLLKNIKALTSKDALHTSIDQFLIPQATHCDVLAADDSGRQDEALDWSACAAAYAGLRLHRGLVVVDTDNNHLAPSWRWAMVHADQIVIPMTARDDTIQQTEVMLRSAAEDPEIGPQKIAEAIVLLSPLPSAPITPQQRETIDRMLQRYSVGELFEMPYDPVFDGQRGRIVYDDLLHGTKCGLVELAATIVDRLSNRAAPAGGFDLVAGAPPVTFTGQFQAQPGGYQGPQQPGPYGYGGPVPVGPNGPAPVMPPAAAGWNEAPRAGWAQTSPPASGPGPMSATTNYMPQVPANVGPRFGAQGAHRANGA